MYTISQEQYDLLGYDLAAELAAFAEAKRVHAFTEGIAAPTARPLVEMIYYRHGGEFQVKESKRYYRVEDGIIVEKKNFLEPPDSSWIDGTNKGPYRIGFVWNEERQDFVDPLIANQPPPEPLTKEQEIAEIRQTMSSVANTFLELQERLDRLETKSELSDMGGN
jgi:hypothetical protein